MLNDRRNTNGGSSRRRLNWAGSWELLQKLVARTSNGGDSAALIDRLVKLVAAAEAGKLHPGANNSRTTRTAGGGKGQRPNTSTAAKLAPPPGPKPRKTEGKGKGLDPFSDFEPVALNSNHWHGTLVTKSDLLDRISAMAVDTHLVVGVFDCVPDDVGDWGLPVDGTVSLLCTSPSENSILVRAPALDKRGTPRALPLHLVQFGKKRKALKWEAAQAKPLPKIADSHVLRVQLFKDHVPAKVWIDTSKNVVSAVRSWLTLLKVPADDIIDIFHPRRIGDGVGFSINVRIAQSASARVEAASGVGGF